MVKFIESELVSLRREVNEMWTIVYNQISKASDAVLMMDKELAQQVILREKRVNAVELKIDSDVEDVIALYNPVAIDLRFVLAASRINNDLERIGDFAEGIAKFVMKCEKTSIDADLLRELKLEVMFNQVLSMLEISKKAFNDENIELATSLFSRDNVLDEINAAVTDILTDYIENHIEDTKICLELIGVFRKLERAGDHITNIAEEIVFFVDAKVLKHMEKENNSSN